MEECRKLGTATMADRITAAFRVTLGHFLENLVAALKFRSQSIWQRQGSNPEYHPRDDFVDALEICAQHSRQRRGKKKPSTDTHVTSERAKKKKKPAQKQRS
ncbi:unnamed protein product [Lasius platythorax]|uniref:Uncharacterized protein n=1 Tax=Lasius platythorax TaxID=488582 RepID=A0AAV2N8Z5_9HYME